MAQNSLQALCRDGDASGAPASVDLRHEFEAVEIAPILAQLDKELIGLAPVKMRIREIASLLLGRAHPPKNVARDHVSDFAHVVHGKSRHRQDHSGA